MRIWLPLLVIALLVGGAWWLLESDEPESTGEDFQPVTELIGSEAAAEVSLSVLSPDGGETESESESREAEDVTERRQGEQPSVDHLPKAYREALSGITGRLVDHEDEPIEGMEVTFLEMNVSRFLSDFNTSFGPPPRLPRLDIGRALTDADGRFRFAGAHAASWHGLGIDLGGERGTLRVVEQTLHPGESYDLGDVKLSPFVTFVGEVVDADGNPVAGARVRATNVPALVFEANVQYLQSDSSLIIAEGGVRNLVRLPREVMKWESKLPFPTTRTDAEGQFRLAGVPIGLITTVVDKPGYSSRIQGPTPSGRSGERSVGTLTLAPGRIARGRVVDVNQKPVKGAQVEVGAACQLGPVAIGVAAKPTDADGRFEVRGLPESGSYLAAARATRSDPWKIVGPIDDEEIVIVLEPRVPFVVFVRDVNEVPIEKAEILLREESPLSELPLAGLHNFGPPPEVAQAAAPGEYHFDRLAAGKYELLVRAPGFAPATEEIRVTEDGAGRDVITLFGGIQVPLQVVDALTQEPVEGAIVQAYGRRRDNVFDRGRTDAEGRATLGPISFVEGVENRIWVEHPAYAGRDVEIGGPGEEIQIPLVRGVDLNGVVHLAGSVPEKSYWLVVTDLNDEGGDHPAREMPRFALTSREDGTFRLTNLPAGSLRWELFVQFLGGDPVAMFQEGFEEPNEVTRGRFELSPDGENYLEIDVSESGLTAPGAVRGTIVVNGDAGVGWRVRGQINSRNQDNEERKIETTADSWGNFVIENVPPGNVYLEIKRPVAPSGRADNSTAWSDWHELMPGETYEPKIEFSQREVSFQVSDATGALVSGANVNVLTNRGRGGSGVRGTTNAQGMVSLEIIGHQAEVTVKKGSDLLEQEIDLSSNRGEPIPLMLSKSIPCEGRFDLDAALLTGEQDQGRDFVYLWVRSTGDGPRLSRSQSVKKDERAFTFAGMKPGRYSIQCWTGGGGMSKPIEFTLPAEGSSNLFFHFEGGGTWGN